MTDHPYKALHDTTETAIDRLMGAKLDVSDASAAAKLAACQALIAVIEQGVKIAHDFVITGEEPYPGAALSVIKTTQRAIEIARLSKLVPPRD